MDSSELSDQYIASRSRELTDRHHLEKLSSDSDAKLGFFIIGMEVLICGYLLLYRDQLAGINLLPFIFLFSGIAAIVGIVWRLLWNWAIFYRAQGKPIPRVIDRFVLVLHLLFLFFSLILLILSTYAGTCFLFGRESARDVVVESSKLSSKFLKTDFVEVKSVYELSNPVKNFFLERVREIAPVDGEFQATDVIIDPPLPSKRLISAGKGGNLSFIWYEHGGYSYHHHLVVFEEEIESIEIIFMGTILTFSNNLAELKEIISEGKFLDQMKDTEEDRCW